MIRCPICKAEYPENTLFCEDCASYLQEDDGEETDPLVTNEVTVTQTGREKVPEKKYTSSVSLKLSISDSGQEVELPLTQEVNIGRLDPASNSFPEVDLASHGGLKKGVSRWHAKILRRGNEVLIEDLASMNGTFLNCRRLSPYFPQALRSGDELKLGDLILQVSFIPQKHQRPA